MNTLARLNKLSLTLTSLLEEMDEILDGTNNTELYNEIDNRVRDEIENALTNLDVAINDIEDGMYVEDESSDEDEDDLDWD